MRHLVILFVIGSYLLLQGCSSLNATPVPLVAPNAPTSALGSASQATISAVTPLAVSPTPDSGHDGLSALAKTSSVNVLDFGARADGVIAADDAFRKAIAASKSNHTVFVPHGRYLLLHGIALPDDTTIMGEGEASVLIAGPSAPISVLYNANSDTGNKHITIDGVRIESNQSTASGGNGIAFHHVTGGRIAHVHVLDSPEAGIVLRASEQITLEDSIVEGSGNDNVHVWDGSAYITITRVTAKNSTGSVATAVSTGFEIADGAHDVTLVDCATSNDATAGISIHNHNAKQVGHDTLGPFNVAIRDFISTGDKKYGIIVMAQGPNPPAAISLERVKIIGAGQRPLWIVGQDGAQAPTDIRQIEVSTELAPTSRPTSKP